MDPAAYDLMGTGDDLVERIASSTGLSPTEAARVIGDVLAFHHESVGDYVRRRHARLQEQGAQNPEIFARLTHEIRGRVFAAPDLSLRQLRRIVYG